VHAKTIRQNPKAEAIYTEKYQKTGQKAIKNQTSLMENHEKEREKV